MAKPRKESKLGLCCASVKRERERENVCESFPRERKKRKLAVSKVGGTVANYFEGRKSFLNFKGLKASNINFTTAPQPQLNKVVTNKNKSNSKKKN